LASIRLDVVERLAVYPSRAAIGSHSLAVGKSS
jgi:hypothetical protein